MPATNKKASIKMNAAKENSESSKNDVSFSPGNQRDFKWLEIGPNAME
jgi:hypothetical protein